MHFVLSDSTDEDGIGNKDVLRNVFARCNYGLLAESKPSSDSAVPRRQPGLDATLSVRSYRCSQTLRMPHTMLVMASTIKSNQDTIDLGTPKRLNIVGATSGRYYLGKINAAERFFGPSFRPANRHILEAPNCQQGKYITNDECSATDER